MLLISRTWAGTRLSAFIEQLQLLLFQRYWMKKQFAGGTHRPQIYIPGRQLFSRILRWVTCVNYNFIPSVHDNALSHYNGELVEKFVYFLAQYQYSTTVPVHVDHFLVHFPLSTIFLKKLLRRDNSIHSLNLKGLRKFSLRVSPKTRSWRFSQLLADAHCMNSYLYCHHVVVYHGWMAKLFQYCLALCTYQPSRAIKKMHKS